VKYESAHPAPAVIGLGARVLSGQELNAAEARFGLRVSARLNERAQAVPHDISERLRIARELAVSKARLQAKVLQPTSAPFALGGGAGQGAQMGLGRGESWWFKLSSAVPLLVLIAGLMAIQYLEGEEQIMAAADVDSALLVDELPPDAYADPGFGEFMKSSGNLTNNAAPLSLPN
jgi:Protein of unknown function (DUF3619)